MTPLAAILQALGHPVLLLVALFLKWWAVWFTLGHFFRRTTALLLAAVGSSWALAQITVLSGSVGLAPMSGDAVAYAPHLSWLSWMVAVLVAWAGLGALESLVLRWGMRKSQRASWKWRRSDLWVYLGWHGLIVIAAAWMAAGRFGPANG